MKKRFEKPAPMVPLGWIARKLRTFAGFINTWNPGYVGSWLAGYPSTDPSRKEIFNGWRPRRATANQLLGPGLGQLTAQCRHIERTTPLGRATIEGLCADIVGSGIGLRPDSGDGKQDLDLQEAFNQWADTAMCDGRSLWAWQNVVVREIGTAGAGLARWVWMDDRAEKGQIPWALLPLEIEWFSEYSVAPLLAGTRFVRGIEFDSLCRPVRYHFRHPEDPAAKGEILPADMVLHIFEVRRAQQLHGEPLLAPAIERMLQDSRLIETELKAAVATAAPAIAITSTNPGLDGNDTDDDGDSITDIPSGATVRLQPGDDVKTIQNNRPSQQIAPFRAGIHGDVAASCRTSQKYLHRDPSRANYSSMRTDELTSKRLTYALKDIVGHGTAGAAYLKLFPFLMLQIGRPLAQDGVKLQRSMMYTLRPDQPEYVDPVKDTAASEFAITNFLSTLEIECASRGKDSAAVMKGRARELEEIDNISLQRIANLQKKINIMNASDPELKLHWSQIVTLGGTSSAPGAYLDAISGNQQAEESQESGGEDQDEQEKLPAKPSKKSAASA